MKIKLFEEKFINSISKRKMELLKEDEVDTLADDLESENDDIKPNEVSKDDENLEQELSDDHDNISNMQDDSMKNIAHEDEVLKKRIEKRIEDANGQIITYTEKIEEFLKFLNDPDEITSIKYAMDNATEGSPIGKLKKTCGTRISRIAADVAGLAQEMRSIVGNVSVEDMLK